MRPLVAAGHETGEVVEDVVLSADVLAVIRDEDGYLLSADVLLHRPAFVGIRAHLPSPEVEAELRQALAHLVRMRAPLCLVQLHESGFPPRRCGETDLRVAAEDVDRYDLAAVDGRVAYRDHASKRVRCDALSESGPATIVQSPSCLSGSAQYIPAVAGGNRNATSKSIGYASRSTNSCPCCAASSRVSSRSGRPYSSSTSPSRRPLSAASASARLTVSSGIRPARTTSVPSG